MDDLLFSQNIDVSEEEVLEVLHIIQDFEPAGVGATNLQECLLIQLRRLQEDNEDEDVDYTLPIIIIEQYFNEFTKKHYDKIVKKSGISERQFRAALKEDKLKIAAKECMNIDPDKFQAYSLKVV